MKFEIVDDNAQISIEFCNWLLSRIKSRLITRIDSNKLSNWDAYLNSQKRFQSVLKKHISTRDVLLAGVQNLSYRCTASNLVSFQIHNAMTPGLNNVSLDSICRMINFGTLNINAYPIFTQVFQETADRLQEYYKEYQEGVS